MKGNGSHLPQEDKNGGKEDAALSYGAPQGIDL